MSAWEWCAAMILGGLIVFLWGSLAAAVGIVWTMLADLSGRSEPDPREPVRPWGSRSGGWR